MTLPRLVLFLFDFVAAAHPTDFCSTVPVHLVRDGQGEGRQAHAVAASWPAQEGHQVDGFARLKLCDLVEAFLSGFEG